MAIASLHTAIARVHIVLLVVFHHFFDGDVGGEAEGAVAEGHGVAERHNSADDGPGHPLVFFRRAIEGLAQGDHFAGRLAAGDRPGVRRTHHYAFEHSLSANQGFFATFKSG